MLFDVCLQVWYLLFVAEISAVQAGVGDSRRNLFHSVARVAWHQTGSSVSLWLSAPSSLSSRTPDSSTPAAGIWRLRSRTQACIHSTCGWTFDRAGNYTLQLTDWTPMKQTGATLQYVAVLEYSNSIWISIGLALALICTKITSTSLQLFLVMIQTW